MKLKAYQIISSAIERGIEDGVRSSYKHTDTPDQPYMVDTIMDRVMLALDDVIDWEDKRVDE